MASDLRLSGHVAFTYPSFTLFQTARFCVVAALEMQSVAVGWQVYEITKRPLDLGFVGLAQFLPGMLLFLLSGHAADRFNRRRLLMVCYAGFASCSALLLLLSALHLQSVHAIYAVLVLLGVVRSFHAPAGRALLPQLVSEEHFPNAVAWGASIFQAATIVGPAAGGFVYAFFHGAAAVYALALATAGGALAAMLPVQLLTASAPSKTVLDSKTILAGIDYIWRHKVILAAISLDLFAVLLGGAVALLPVYAREILRTGPWGLGLLRSAPGVGAALTAILLAYRPLRGRIGLKMMICVGGFGVSTILFGISRSLWFSLLCLVILGATDMVSVIIRSILVQVATPDAMRGRVNAVEMIFVGASNEFGQFESGLTAQWFGTVPAVVLGGAGTLLVIAVFAMLFPELRNAEDFSPAME